MSEITDAFSDLMESQSDVVGVQTANFDGTSVEVIAEAMDYDDVCVAGGVAESGGYKLMCLSSAFTARPKKNSPVTLDGLALYVLKIQEDNGVLTVMIGDPASE